MPWYCMAPTVQRCVIAFMGTTVDEPQRNNHEFPWDGGRILSGFGCLVWFVLIVFVFFCFVFFSNEAVMPAAIQMAVISMLSIQHTFQFSSSFLDQLFLMSEIKLG